MIQSKIEEKPKSGIEVNFTIPDEDIKKRMPSFAKKIAKNYKIKGFRPGFAPVDKIIEYVGKEEVVKKLLDEIINEEFSKLVLEKEYELIGKPNITIEEAYKEGGSLKYKISFDVLPRITLPDLSKLSFEKVDFTKIKVSEDEIKKVTDSYLNSRAKTQVVGRGAKDGDLIVMDFDIYSEGKIVENASKKDYSFVIEEKKDNLFPGLAREIVGLKAGQDKEFSLKVPNDKSFGELKGKKVAFKVKVKSVSERILPELNDSFVSSVIGLPSVAEFKKSIEDRFAFEKKQELVNMGITKLIEKLRKEVKMEIPDALIKAEQDSIYAEFANNMARYGVAVDDYLKKIKQDKEKMMEGFLDEARGRVETTLILQAASMSEGIEVSKSEIKKQVTKLEKNGGEFEKYPTPQKDGIARVMLLNNKVLSHLAKKYLGV